MKKNKVVPDKTLQYEKKTHIYQTDLSNVSGKSIKAQVYERDYWRAANTWVEIARGMHISKFTEPYTNLYTLLLISYNSIK